MSGLETAIRNALERAERSNPEVRARIYQSARQALETGLRKQDVTDPATVAAQRHRLEAAIKAIETEERHRLGIAVADPQVEIAYGDFEDDMASLDDARPAEDRSTDDSDFGALRAERLGEPAADPAPRATDDPSVLSGMPSGRPSGRASGRPSAAARPKKKSRGFFARMFIWVMLLAFILMGAWWAYVSGLFLTAAERDTSVANPPAAVSEEDLPEPGGNTGPALDSNNFSKDWIEIFKPGDVDRVSAGSLANAKLVSTGDGPVIRITSTSSGADGAVRILLPAESLSQAEGAQATIAISLRSSNDKPVQVTVDCDLAGQGSCERHRFTVTSQRSDALIQVVREEGSEAGGTPALVLNSDVTGEGGGVDLLAVRLLPVP